MSAKEHSIPLKGAKAKGKPDIQKAKNSIAEVRKYLKKHFRGKETAIAKEVNEAIWKQGNNTRQKIQVQAVEKEGKIKVYLKESKELREEKEKAKAAAKKPEASGKKTQGSEEKEKAAGAESKEKEAKKESAAGKKQEAKTDESA